MEISACKACVLLWVMGDFFQLQLLTKQSIEALQNRYLSTCVLPCKDGVVAAYIDHPHAQPCQKALVTLFNNADTSWTKGTAIRQVVDEVPAFGADMFKASLDKAEATQARGIFCSPAVSGDAGAERWGRDKNNGWGKWASDWGTGKSGADDWGQGGCSDVDSTWG
ncbi:uncharacterized protein E0L32_000804 [Thyridium curvatum]|uniref:Uncharacterized protein n=1 Tax=Thyridium curvatum TaxID=1093900 RepID=A0A507AYN1_9PEZI|nr:uncharacterized protein E0L32_000804 [Thyridium curvatum]TPX12627.1 hypothetical protein E0L32_000804 [Thyridium curvatum]